MDPSNSRKIISSTLVERTQNGFYLHLPLQLDFYLPNLAPKFHSFLQSWAVSLLMVRRSKCQNFTAFLAFISNGALVIRWHVNLDFLYFL